NVDQRNAFHAKSRRHLNLISERRECPPKQVFRTPVFDELIDTCDFLFHIVLPRAPRSSTESDSRSAMVGGNASDTEGAELSSRIESFANRSTSPITSKVGVDN